MKNIFVAGRVFISVWCVAVTVLLFGCQQEHLVGPEDQPLAPTGPQSINHPPEIISLPITDINRGDIYLYQPRAVDQDLDSLLWSLETAPDGMLMNPETGLIAGQGLSAGEHVVSVMVNDGQGGSVGQEFLLTVRSGPVIVTNPPRYTFTGTPYRYRLQATDPDGLKLSYMLTAGPAGMTLDQDDGELEWLVERDGEFPIELSVSNSLGQTDNQSFLLKVLPPDGILVVSTPVGEAYTTQVYTYQITIISSGSNTVHYSLIEGPAGMLINPVSGLIEWTPAVAGDFIVEVAVQNEHGFQDTQRYSLRVHAIEAMDEFFSEQLNGLFRSLGDGDLYAAMQFLTPAAQTRLGPLLAELVPYMDEVTGNYTVPVRISINPDMAEYMLRRTSEQGDRVFMLTFLRDFDGNWKINDL